MLLSSSRIFADSAKVVALPEVQWKEDALSAIKSRVAITTVNQVVKKNQLMFIDVRFANGGDWGNDFFNVFLGNQGAAMPASLAVFDAKHRYVGNALFWMGGSRHSNTADDWTRIPTDSYVGTQIRVDLGLVEFKSTVSGVYYLQMIYNKSFVTPRPLNEEQIRAFRTKRDLSELFRSNIVKIEIVNKKPTAP